MNNLTLPAESKVIEHAPRLTPRGLTIVLATMCAIPIATISGLYWYMPKVYEGQLAASVSAEGLPPAAMYDLAYDARPKQFDGVLIVNNLGDQDWTHLNIQINGHYQIYDRDSISAGGSRRYRLDRFVNRTGAVFNLRYNPLKSVRIYARRPTKDRATFFTEFDWQNPHKTLPK
jgi:hypothetical protein